MLKKAQGLSLTTIVIAAIALLVLVILALIFTGSIRKWFVNVESCDSQGGVCQTTKCDQPGEKEIPYSCDLNRNGKPNEGRTIDGICCLKT